MKLDNKKPLLFDLSLKQLEDAAARSGEPGYRAKQIQNWTYKKFASSFDDMSDLPLRLRKTLKEEVSSSGLAPLEDKLSSDGWTRKILFGLRDGAQVETVLMGYRFRRTACISTQAGCGLGCTFCATGQAGLQRNITAGEIVEQALFFDRILHRKKERLTNLVFMGMGEPFANYENVMKAVDILTDPEGYSFGARRITISTVGLIPEIEKFAGEKKQVNLAVSLHAADDELRSSMLPVNKKYPLDALIPACRDYTLSTGRRLSFEWAMIDNVNDTADQASRLAKLIKGMLCHVNLIPLNPTRGYDGSGSRRDRIKRFREILTSNAITNTLRLRRGVDINAGCGQLRQEHEKKKNML